MPETTSARSLRDHFATLPDPRIDRTKRHLLVDILFMTLAALLAGAEDCVRIADFARTKQRFFAQWLELPNGIPSHDTFNRVLARLDPDALNRCFLQWVAPIRQKLSAKKAEWTGLVRIGRVESHRTTATGTSCHVRYFLSSLPAKTDQDLRLFGRAVRLHWVLDIAFRGDACRLRKDHAAQNVAVIRHIAMNLLRQVKVSKMGVKNRRLKAGWDEDYLLSLLAD